MDDQLELHLEESCENAIDTSGFVFETLQVDESYSKEKDSEESRPDSKDIELVCQDSGPQVQSEDYRVVVEEPSSKFNCEDTGLVLQDCEVDGEKTTEETDTLTPTEEDKVPTLHTRLVSHMRKQFFSEIQEEREVRSHGSHKLKRSMTERGPRKPPRDYSIDSGLSSPGSCLSQDEMFYSDPQQRMTRHMSVDRLQLNRSKIYRSICDLQAEAQQVQNLVHDMTSTQTMRRRRTASAGLSISARRQLAKESITSYTPIAPAESMWGQRFDEIIARLRGCEISPDDAHVCNESDRQDTENKISGSKTYNSYKSEPILSQIDDGFEDQPLASAATEENIPADQSLATTKENTSADGLLHNTDYENKQCAEIEAVGKEVVTSCAAVEQQHTYQETLQPERSEDSSTIPEQFAPECQEAVELTDLHNNNTEYVDSPKAEVAVQEEVIPVVIVQQQCAPEVTERMCQSLTEESFRPSKSELKSLLRSISFHRPDLVSHKEPMNKLRRTDSNNDVWIERPKVVHPNHQSSVSLATTRSRTSSRWKRFTRMLSFNNKAPIQASS